MKYIYLIIISFLFSLLACNNKGDVKQEDYPNADAAFINLTKEYILNEDGSVDYNYSHRVKLFSYLATNRRGETFIIYNPKFQELKINKSVTTMADGKEVASPDNAFNLVLPAFAKNSPEHNQMREMVVTHTGLERNAIIDLQYQLKSKKDFCPILMGIELLAETAPIKELTIIISVPEGKELHYNLINSTVEPEISNKDKRKIYKWVFENVKAIINEDPHVEENLSVPQLTFSTENMNVAYNYLLNQDAFNYQVNEQMANKVKEIIKGKESTLDKALEIQKSVVNDFNYFHIPPFYDAFKIRTSQEVWKSNGGILLEKVVLFTSLLKSAGINAEPVAIAPKNMYNKTGVLSIFNDYLVKVNIEGSNPLYLSASEINNQNLLYKLYGKLIMPLKKSTSEFATYSEDKKNNSAKIKGEFIIDKSNKIASTFAIQLDGYLNTFLQPSKDEAKVKGVLKAGIFSGALKDIDVNASDSNGTAISYKVETDTIKQKAGYTFITLPEISNGRNTWGIDLLLEKRNTTLLLPSTHIEEYEYTFTLPENTSLVTPETRISESYTIGNVKIEINVKEGKVNVIRSLTILNNIINTEEYKGFKTLMNVWDNKNYKQIIFKKKV